MTESIDFNKMLSAIKDELILREKYKNLNNDDADRLAEDIVAKIRP